MDQHDKSAAIRGVDEVQAAVTPMMKAAGFRKRGRSYNRPADDGLIHVVSFRSRLRSLCGTLHVEYGVFIPEVYNFENNNPPPKFLQDYHCEIRQGLHIVISDDINGWSAVKDVGETARAFPTFFDVHVFPFFDRFFTRQAVVDEWERTGRLVYNDGRSSPRDRCSAWTPVEIGLGLFFTMNLNDRFNQPQFIRIILGRLRPC